MTRPLGCRIIAPDTRATLIEFADKTVLFKLKSGEKLATRELLEDRAEDLRLEEEKTARYDF
jgi:hypothetical protein